ncbi:MAG: HNH endonuclease [Clostridia bacterium]|nr:HNH endonuclease [Clostridia bacterium]
MYVEFKRVKIEEIMQGYVDNSLGGVYGYNFRLMINPTYTLDLKYPPKKRNAVIKSILNGYPLGVMHWAKNDDGTFELLDGMHRTLSFCRYINGVFPVNGKYFKHLTSEEQHTILDHTLLVYVCEGTAEEKLEWCHIVNTVGKRPSAQEMRNVAYSCEWLNCAKRRYSFYRSPGYLLAKDYVGASCLRQGLLETALHWISDGKIESYMAAHRYDEDDEELWAYFQNVIEWVKHTFPVYREEMKGVNWGKLYNEFKDKPVDCNSPEKKIAALMQDDEVFNKKGIYAYVLTGDEKLLDIRRADAKTDE